MHVRVKNRLSLKHAVLTATVAFALGLAMSLVQIWVDMRQQSAAIDTTVEQVLATARDPAAQAAFALDELLAARVADGLFEYAPIYHVEMYDDYGRPLTVRTREKEPTRFPQLAAMLFDSAKVYSLELFMPDRPNKMGDLRVRVDTGSITADFFDRAILTIGQGLLGSLALAIILTLCFYALLTRPLLATVTALGQVDPEHPGRDPLTVPPRHEHDELGLLVRTTNKVLGRLDETLEEQRRSEMVAAEREARLAGIMDNVADGIITLTESWEIESCNPSARALLRRDGQQIIGSDFSDWLQEPDKSRLLRALIRYRDERDVEALAEVPAELQFDSDEGPISVALAVSEMRRDGARMLICVLHDITERKRFEAQLIYMANHDPLTDLPNRTLLEDRLDQALARARRTDMLVAVLFLDLDRFKLINDSLGHEIGDLLLSAAADRLVRSVRRSDTVGRLGGDEFMVVVGDIGQSHDAARVAETLLRALSRPFDLDGRQLFVSASVGIALAPADGEGFQDLMRNADTAMYAAKGRGGSTYQFYTQSMNDTAVARLSMETSLREALEEGQFELYYQPKNEIGSLAPVGLEALLRWTHPTRGAISPLHFIPVAEETGLIEPIGEWVVREACRQVALWEQEGIRLPVAVNLSPLQFSDGTIAEKVKSILQETGAPAELIEFEITESVMMNGTAHVVGLLTELRTMGHRIAIDDFGTGYSSLSYLKRLPITALKIDRTFVRDIADDPDDAAITSTIIAMGRSLGLKTVAEGVETDEQIAFLRDQGCDEMQGFYISPPVPAIDLPAVLTGRHAPAERRHG